MIRARPATIEYTDVAALADLSFDVFRIIGRKPRPEDDWYYTFGDPLKAMQKMIDDGVLIPHHKQDASGCTLLLGRLSKRAPLHKLGRVI